MSFNQRFIQWQDEFIHHLLRILARLPLAVLHQCGTVIGLLIHWLPNRQRRNTLINLALCFPELSDRQVVQLRRRSLIELGKTYFEIAYLWQRPVAEVFNLIHEVRGGELLHTNSPHGLIVLSPHLGAWELAGLYLAAQRPTTIFYKPQQQFDAMIRRARHRTGATLAPISATGIRLLVKALAQGEAVGILPDQAPRTDKGAVFAPFFNVPAYTMLLVQRLAQRTGATVIFLFAERLNSAAGYRIHCLAAPSAINHADDQVAAAALNQGIENCIRHCPEQYLWNYRRFRERPAGWAKLYSGANTNQAALSIAKQRLREWR
ncbi:lysophospholipid acyltransferase family protein [Thiospirillum jenense]|uniref:Lipid A biosynthesis acyltransferase n=1 Tax=Thiospirillum jenense TaxID=1653858 RepID=A0A839HE97_9GAMM|nr:lipid A biosynthesis acyltransferase [Thiospirillum jenense]MBB1125339.1 lipid A biosynthesis acyltransferase [Thiospirillum jenense]